MKIELLKTFLEVSRTLHFRLASESLFITQSAVSARIKLLEDELGVLLFDRSQNHLKLTAEGERLIKHANEIILMWQKTKQDISITDNNSQQLAIGSMMSIWDIVLQEWLQKIHKNRDDISLLTATYNPVELRKNILNRIVDIAFLFEPTFAEELITEKIATVPLHLVTSEQQNVNHPFTLSNYVKVDYGESINSQYMRDYHDAPAAKHCINQPIVALNFLLGVGGSAYLPRQLTEHYLASKQLYLVNNAPVYSRDIYANYLAKNEKIELIEDTLKLFSHVNI